MERPSDAGRLGGSGVQGGSAQYQEYNEFLNSSYLQLSTNDIHDYLNEHGLRVKNGAGQFFTIGGDGSLLREDGSAIEVAVAADNKADQAIHELIATGKTSIKPDDIFKLFPNCVVVEGKH